MAVIRLNASALPRVLACLGSTQFPNTAEVESTEAAREGTAAHHAAECTLKGLPIPDVAPNGYAIDAEMREHAADYAAKCGGAEVGWTEIRTDWLATSQIEIACKIDRAWYADGVLYIRDYKYGWRLVDPENNAQLIAGAVGTLRKLAIEGRIFPPHVRIDMGIYQPRPYHPEGALRTWPISLDELVAAHDALVAELAKLPSSDLVTGPHCEHCPGAILGTCPAYLAASGNAIDVATRGGPMDVTPAQMARELVNLERASKVLEQRHEWLKDSAKRALKAGQIVPGWAIETGYGQTVWTIEPDELRKLTNADVLTAPKLVTPAEAKRHGVSEDVIKANTKRPVTGDKLVRRDPDAFVRKKVGKGKKNT